MLRQFQIKQFDLEKGLSTEPPSSQLLEQDVRNIDWEKVAKEIPTKNAYECELQWKNLQTPLIRKTPFDAVELEELKSLVEKYQGRHWQQIATELNVNF